MGWTDRKGKPMENDKNGLSEKQEMALELAVTGMTDVEIARQVGVKKIIYSIY